MHAHADDLRAEVANDWPTLTGDAATPDSTGLDDWVHRIVDDWRSCRLSPALRSLLEYVEKVTLAPALISQADVAAVRQAGSSDRAIHDAVQVAAYFNYINRVADALGIEPEPGLREWGRDWP